MAVSTINYAEFQNLMKAGKTVLVDFWAPWCSYCRRIDSVYEKIARQYSPYIMVVRVNVDEEPVFAREEGIEVIPTMVIYRGGEDIGSIVAPESKSMIEAFLLEFLGDECVVNAIEL